MKALGRHVIGDIFNCDKQKLNDLDYVKSAMIEAAKISGATIVDTVFHRFSPQGISGTVVIAESHLAIHTWPEYGFCAIDLFTCGETVDPYKAFSHLEKMFDAKSSSVKELKRGKQNQVLKNLKEIPLGKEGFPFK